MDSNADHSEYSKHGSIRARQAHERGDLDTLLSLLNSTDRLDRISAVANLGRIKDPRVVAALRRCLHAGDEACASARSRHLRRWVIGAL
jgi:HEAT repeat protein